jgi:hypothetical protein
MGRIRTYIFAYAILALSMTPAMARAQQTDPVLTAAVEAQTLQLKDIFDHRKTTQEKILLATGIEDVQLQKLRAIQDSVLSYLSNASLLMKDAYQVRRAAELVTKEIPRNISSLSKAAKGHLKGTVIALAVSQEISNIYTETAGLSSLMASLVTSGSVEYTGLDGSRKRQKVNLLNGAERYWICQTVLNKLEDINSSLYILAWQVKTLSWQDLWMGLDPDSWAVMMQTKWIGEDVISDWKGLL